MASNYKVNVDTDVGLGIVVIGVVVVLLILYELLESIPGWLQNLGSGLGGGTGNIFTSFVNSLFGGL